MQQAYDFRDESEALYDLVKPLDENDYATPTLFKNWTINDVLQHLHHYNIMADYSLNDPEKFIAEIKKVNALREKTSFVEASNEWLEGIKGPALLEAWRNYYVEMTPRFASVDPKHRVKWVGPDMSVRSSITARLMETWAHGQEIYDVLGPHRVNSDRIRNVAHLGINTFGWTFANRKQPVPEPMPYVVLSAPSGDIWEWGTPSENEFVKGAAEEFCQVVCQTRNIADTNLEVVGTVANRWMSIAQCFAGVPRDPPAPGTRVVNPNGLLGASN